MKMRRLTDFKQALRKSLIEDLQNTLMWKKLIPSFTNFNSI